MRLLDLADYLRSEGLTVVETAGWKTRGRELTAMPDTIIAHHTATPASANGDLPTLRLLIQGREDLPGPLCQLALSRSGIVHVIASGKANHAGQGMWRGQASSARTIGIEAENPGDGKPWNVRQLDAYERLCAALCRYLGVTEERVAGHKEWALPEGRKVDPRLDMDVFRDRVRSHLNPPAPTKAGPDVFIVKDPESNRQFLTNGLTKRHIKTADALRAYKAAGVPVLVLDPIEFAAIKETA